MEASTIFIWILRVVPMVLFWLYLKSQSSKDDKKVLDKRNVVTRAKMLQQRAVVLGEVAPPAMKTINLVDQTTAPSLFAGQRTRAAPKKREKKEKKDTPGGSKVAEEKKEREEAALAVEKMHLESLVNYMAFNRKEQQRTFLLNESNPPPPPPPKKPPVAGEDGPNSIQVSTATSGKANSEAQMVLKGAIKYQRCDVAKDLYEQLVESRVEIAELTFSLMIEACIVVGDLKDAGDFLMKMEAAGYCPDAELLDKVMDLYSQHKATRESTSSEKDMEDRPSPPPTVSLKKGKLSSDAPAFNPASDGLEPMELNNSSVLDDKAVPFFPAAAAEAAGEGPMGAFNFDAYSEDED